MTQASPSRFQRKRTAGWRMPRGSIYVGRPTAFGNPFPVDVYGQAEAVDLYRRWLKGDMSSAELAGLSRSDKWSDPPRRVSLWTVRSWVLPTIVDLRGHHLVCWCPLDKPCHADVLLEIANA